MHPRKADTSLNIQSFSGRRWGPLHHTGLLFGAKAELSFSFCLRRSTVSGVGGNGAHAHAVSSHRCERTAQAYQCRSGIIYHVKATWQ